MSTETQGRSRTLSFGAAVVAVAATYFYFLIFSEFAFLELARAVASKPEHLQAIMVALGAGGIGGAVLGATVFDSRRGRMLLVASLLASAVAAALALFASHLAFLVPVAAISGASLGALTVVLASLLHAAVGGSGLGLCIGLGTGLAYALCNVPLVFQAPPEVQTWMASLAVAAAALGVRCMHTGEERRGGAEEGAPIDKLTPGEVPPCSAALRNAGGPPYSEVTRWVAIFLVLVWLDSAAFYIVQHTSELRAHTWQTTGSLYANALLHLAAAVIAGWWLDRGGRGVLAATAVVALAAAGLELDGVLPAWIPANWTYTAGVSLYSVALVEFPARSRRAGIAAVVFAVAGWLGSALGIGMAQELARIPLWFVAAAVTVVAVALAMSRNVGRAAAAVVLVAVAAGSARGEDEVALGREVYIAEGCIHCHSQYVRPKVRQEVMNWGPAETLQSTLSSKPPLIGTRRQGPDLSHVGNRRSPEWNRLHLISPQAVSPGSRMPSYRHLFGREDGRGEALLAYLATLGAGTAAQRQSEVEAWQPEARTAIPAKKATALFNQLCAQCHGEGGRGDGPLASKLSLRPPDWRRDRWRHVSVADEVSLGRIIKFGLPGLAMAGHEYLPDAEILGLAQHVLTLHKVCADGSAVAAKP